MTPIERAEQAVRDALICGTVRKGEERNIVRAVLTAIREPGKAVLGAGITAAEEVEDWTRDSHGTYRYDTPSDMPLPVWQAMIDAMLAEEG